MIIKLLSSLMLAHAFYLAFNEDVVTSESGIAIWADNDDD